MIKNTQCSKKMKFGYEVLFLFHFNSLKSFCFAKSNSLRPVVTKIIQMYVGRTKSWFGLFMSLLNTIDCRRHIDGLIITQITAIRLFIELQQNFAK